MSGKTKTPRLVITALFAVVIAVCAKITIPIGAVPFSMAVFGVFLTGAMLPPSMAAASVAVYMLMGIAGIPVFAKMEAGPQVLAGPTGGFLIGYFALALAPALALNSSAASKQKQKIDGKIFHNTTTENKGQWTQAGIMILASLAGLAACYLLGSLWFMYVTGSSLTTALMLCVVPFIIPDIGKAVLAYTLARILKQRLKYERATG